MMPEENPTKPGRRPSPMPAFPDEAKTTPQSRTARPAQQRGRPEFDFNRDPRHDPE
jgi:hypothetical protein